MAQWRQEGEEAKCLPRATNRVLFIVVLLCLAQATFSLMVSAHPKVLLLSGCSETMAMPQRCKCLHIKPQKGSCQARGCFSASDCTGLSTVPLGGARVSFRDGQPAPAAFRSLMTTLGKEHPTAVLRMPLRMRAGKVPSPGRLERRWGFGAGEEVLGSRPPWDGLYLVLS